MRMLKDICKEELTGSIIPFWNKLYDGRGGFYGQTDLDLAVSRNAPKGVVLHSRILWFYSAAFSLLKDELLLDYADHAFRFLSEKCYDYEFGGLFWMMDCCGEPLDFMKHTYNQAFAIYGFSEYFKVSGNEKARALALKIFDDIETKASDDFGYGEAFSRNWIPQKNIQLTDEKHETDKTMNTMLCLLEAYTELFRITGSRRVKDSLKKVFSMIAEKGYDPKKRSLSVFFTRNLNTIGDIQSYGHDIEFSWIVEKVSRIIDDKKLALKAQSMSDQIADNMLSNAFENGAVFTRREGNVINKRRLWWIQAESVIGFANAYQHTNDTKFLDACKQVLGYILKYQKDKRSGEWFPVTDESGAFVRDKDDFLMSGEWKSPFHNSRMCIEIINRGL